jgi:hypothetical protein
MSIEQDQPSKLTISFIIHVIMMASFKKVWIILKNSTVEFCGLPEKSCGSTSANPLVSSCHDETEYESQLFRAKNLPHLGQFFWRFLNNTATNPLISGHGSLKKKPRCHENFWTNLHGWNIFAGKAVRRVRYQHARLAHRAVPDNDALYGSSGGHPNNKMLAVRTEPKHRNTHTPHSL